MKNIEIKLLKDAGNGKYHSISETKSYALAGHYKVIGLFDPETDIESLSIYDIENAVIDALDGEENIDYVMVDVPEYNKAICMMLMEIQQKCRARCIQLRVLYTDNLGCY